MLKRNCLSQVQLLTIPVEGYLEFQCGFFWSRAWDRGQGELDMAGHGIRLMMEVFVLVAISSAGSLMLVSCSGARGSKEAPSQAGPQGQTQPSTQATSAVQNQRKQAEQQARPEVEKERKQAEDEAKTTLDQEAITAVSQTQKAVDAIAAGKTDEALAAIEQATGKINILLARNPANALIPVDLNVELIDTAPRNSQAVLDIAKDASRALDEKDYPAARALLFSLMSEIRVRTYNVPLATYPQALQEAARLLDQKATNDATSILLTALDTLVVVDHVTPVPLLLARESITQAQTKSQQDKNGAQVLLEVAKKEVARARELGYAAKDQEYEALNRQISTLEKQLKGPEDATVAFSKLKEKLSAFLKRQSDQKRG